MYNNAEKRYYWGEKEKFAQKAKEHSAKMQEKFPEKIANSIKNSKVYNETHFFSPVYQIFNTVISVEDNTSEEAIASICKEFNISAESKESSDVAVLNFASYKFPGGGFLMGSKAQEECLCHASTLFNVISNEKFGFYYEDNRSHLNRALYFNRAIYSPDIIFNDKYKAAVVTCAAPNYTAAHKYQRVSREENKEVLKARIEYVLRILSENNAAYLVLGAFGCGVFGQDPTEVASIFKEFLENEFKGAFKKVVFAIPKTNRNHNYEAFKTMLT